MDLERLQQFTEVAKLGSFAAVAKSLEVDPSLVSRAVAGLEEELGVKLFYRTTRKLSLTEAGTAFLAKIEPLLEEFESARLAAVELKDQPSGLLRVTSTISFGALHLAPRIARFLARYPQIKIDLLATDAVVNLVEERIDVAIRFGHLRDSSYISRKLTSLSYVLCASPEYLRSRKAPKVPADIAQHACLQFLIPGFNQGWKFRHQRSGKIEHVDVAGPLRISNAIALKEATLAGMGIALLPTLIIEEEIKAKKLKLLFADYDVTATDFDAAVWVLYPSREFLPGKIKAFTDFLAKEFRS